MANTRFQAKRTSTSGLLPNTTNSGNLSYIAAGEFAVNLTDQKVLSSNGTLTFEVGANLSSLAIGTAFIANSAQITIGTGVELSANGGTGTAGQVLTSNGATGSPYWSSAGGAAYTFSTGLTDTAGTITVNSAYIATISSNNSSFLGGVAAASYALLSGAAFTGAVSGITTLAAGNTTITGFVNVVSDSAQLRVGNTTNFFIGNTSGIFPASNNEGKSFGATTRRWDINAGTITMAGSLSGITTLAAGNTSITGFANVSTSVNSALLTVGTSFIANTTGAYHTGTMNAASFTTTGVTINTTAIVPTSNSSGQTLGNSISRFVISANTINASGTLAAGDTTLTGSLSLSDRISQTGTVTNAGGYISLSGQINSTQTGQQNMFTMQSQVSPQGNGTLTSLYGLLFLPTIVSSANNITNLQPVFARADSAASYTGTVDAIYTYSAGTPSWSSATAIGNVFQYTAFNATATTAVRGFWSQISAGAGKWGFYGSGTANNYMAGSLGIGTTSLTAALTVTGAANVSTSVNSALLTVGTSFIANSTGVTTTGFANVSTSIQGGSSLTIAGAASGITTLAAGNTTITGFANVTTSVNSAILSVGTSFIANTSKVAIGTAVGLEANGGIGTAGQVLHSNGTSIYWAADDNAGGTVTSVATANGLSGGPITTTGTLGVTTGSTLTVNTAGIHVNSALSITSLTLAGAASGVTTLAAGNTTITGDITVSGNLTINGTTTNINSTNLVVEDKNIILADVTTPTEVTADGGGITLKGATDKTFNWVNATASWTSSENLDLAAGKTYKIGTTTIANSTALGTGILASSLTSVGTLSSLTLGGAVSGVTTLAAGNTSITGFANVTSTIQGGSSLTIAGAASGITTLAAGNTSITGFANVSTSVNSALLTVGTSFIANSTGTTTNVASWGAAFRASNSTNFSGIKWDDTGGTIRAGLYRYDNSDLTISIYYSNGTFQAAPVVISASTGTVTLSRLATTNGVFSGAVSGITTLAAGNTSITGFANVSTSVNSALLTVGSSFIANTTGAYHTGTVNAASHTVGTSFIANSTGITTTGFANVSTSIQGGSSLTIAGALSGVTTAAMGNTTITGFANVSTTLQVGTNTATFGTAVYIIASGNTGIGTSSPASLFHVKRGSNATETYPTNTWAARIINATDANTENGLVVGNRWAAAESTVFEAGSIYGGGTGVWSSYYKITGVGTHIWGAGAAGAEKMRIDANGNTGIGNSAPTTKLSVNGTTHLGGTLAAGNTSITGFANVTSTIQGGSSLTIAGAASGITTLAAGNTSITGFANVSTSVNSALLTVGTSFIANTTGAYHTGTVNAASFTTTGLKINTTGIVPTSNSSGQNLGNSISRFVLSANTIDTTGAINIAAGQVLKFNNDVGISRSTAATLSIGNGTQNDSTGTISLTGGLFTGAVNAASHTVGSSFIANTSSTTITDTTAAANSNQIFAVKNGSYVLGVAPNAPAGAYNNLTTAGDTLIVVTGNSGMGNANLAILPWSGASGGLRMVTVANSTTFSITGNTSITGFANVSTSVNSAALSVGTSFVANTTQVTIAAGVKLSANGGTGTAGQVLHSNGATGSPYWATAAGATVNVAGNYTWTNSHTWTSTANATFDSIATANNGSGTNVKIGDDVWLGDINTADTLGVRGQQSANNGYIVFGNADTTTKLGRAGAGALTYNGPFSLTGTITSNATTGFVHSTASSVSLQMAESSAIRNVGAAGGTMYFDCATGGATAGAFVYRVTSSFTTITTINGSGTQTTSLGVGTAPSGTAGEIRATNNITAYYSDERLKENITPISNALEKVQKISGVTFNSNDTAAEFGYTDKKTQVGVIAQEIEAVLPEIVVPAPFDIGQDDDGNEYSLSGEYYKTVQYDKLIPLLIEAIKEQQNHINRLEDKINSIQNNRE